MDYIETLAVLAGEWSIYVGTALGLAGVSECALRVYAWRLGVRR
jgi:hypothetical protein